MKLSDIANKKVLLDIPTNNLLGSLQQRRIDYGLSVRELAEKLCIAHSNIRYYERRMYPPSLLTLMNIAKFFSFDLSDSLNYKFFHGLISAEEINARMKFLGLTCRNLAT